MSFNPLCIIPECYVDTNLIAYLVNNNVNHQHCCSKVVGTLKGKFKDRFAVGIIDRDKDEVGYLSECEEIISSTHLCIWKHRSLPHFLITIRPAIDGFLLDCAQEQGVSPETFGLPSELEDFINRTKKITSNIDPALRRLIEAIRENGEIVALKKILQYLLENTYHSKNEEIKAFFPCSVNSI